MAASDQQNHFDQLAFAVIPFWRVFYHINIAGPVGPSFVYVSTAVTQSWSRSTNDLGIAADANKNMPSIRQTSKQIKERKANETHKLTLKNDVEGRHWDEPTRVVWNPYC
jgi:hypothetical protein